jgi:hypothetical protein
MGKTVQLSETYIVLAYFCALFFKLCLNGAVLLGNILKKKR